MHLGDEVDQHVALCRLDLGWCEHAAPVGRRDIHAQFLQGGHVHARDAAVARHRQRDHAAGLDLLFEFRVTGNARRDLATQDGRIGRAAAGERHIGRLTRIAAQLLDDQAEQQVVGATGAATGHGHRLGVGLDGGFQVLPGLDLAVGRHGDHAGLFGEARDRGDVAHGDRALVGNARTDHDRTADHQAVALALALVHITRQADHAAGAADVLELHVAHQAGGLGRALDGACGAVPTAAGRCRHEHVEGVEHGLALRPGRQDQGGAGCGAQAQKLAFGKRHGCLLCENEKWNCRPPGADRHADS